jgi:hypothetical protein
VHAAEIPRWICTPTGKTRSFAETRPPTSSGIHEKINGPKNLSIFTLKVLKSVDVSSGDIIATAEPGDTIIAFAATALDFYDGGLVEIVSELRP